MMEYIYSKDSISKGPELNILPYFANTLPELLKNAITVGVNKGIIFVEADGSETTLLYKDLLEEASRVLTGLRSNGMKAGDNVVIQVDNDRYFLLAFWGIVLGGGIPVPLAIPNSFPISEGSEKVASVCSLLRNAFIVTDQDPSGYRDVVSRAVLIVSDLADNEPDRNYNDPDPDDIAYVQFSSGSTGDAKGVILTHRNILVNIYAIIEASGNPEQLRIRDELLGKPLEATDIPYSTCSWLPYSHDMGLIGFHLTPMAGSIMQIKMSTTTFVINPTLNLLLIDKYRITQIPSPNFGLLWMLYMIKDESIKGIDLSCVDALFNGAEPISPMAVRLFIDRFRQYGFNPKSMFPVYGMAEASLLVTAPPRNSETLYHMLDRGSFTENHVAVDAKTDLPVIEFVDEGYPAMGMELRIVDSEDNVVNEGKVGHIQIKGPNVTSGYYKKEELNSELFCDGWLRTGDLGFLLNDRLTVTGRHKDVIFVNGQNYYSHDIEEELQQLPFVGFKNMAVCGVTDHDRGTENIVLFIKTKKSKESLIELLEKINKHLGVKIRVGIEAIVPMHDIPRTTSGKVQRFILREKYEAGGFRDREIKRLDQRISPYSDQRTERKHSNLSISKGPELNILPFFANTLPELLKNAITVGVNKGIIFVEADGSETILLYKDLLEEASRVLTGLRSNGMKAGDKVVIQVDNDRYFLLAFWGIVLGGGIPVPLAIPNSFPISEGSEKVASVCSLLRNAFIVTDQDPSGYRDVVSRAVLIVSDLADNEPDRNYNDPDPDDIAYVQFSSGSTGDAKGVILTHRNILVNLYAIVEASGNPEQLRIRDELLGKPLEATDIPYSTCSWLPYSHDMGLIGFHLTPMAGSMLQIKMSTTTFVINPTLNLLLIDKYRITQIPSPNFGLLWMLYMIKDESIKGIDLSCIDILFNGAEPISPMAVRLFIDRFRQYGFNPKSMFPVYGMAEASLMITAPPRNTETVYHLLDRESFSKKHIAVNAKEDLPAIEFVDEGYPAMGMEIRIVDDDDDVVKEGTVGHIQIKGPNVTSGYYKKEELNSELFCDEWLRTGDLGFLLKGRLTVTGRFKDVIFVNGQNYYSHDLEEELQQLPFVGFKNMAVCGVTDHDKGSESIVLFIKTKKPKENLIELLEKINKHLGAKIRVGIEAIVPMHDIPRTTSGKVQRFILRERYEAGDFRDREVRRLDQRIYPENDRKIEHEIIKKEEVHYKTKDIDLKGLLSDMPYALAESNVHQFLPHIVKNLPQVLRIASLIAPDSGILHVDEYGNENLQTYSELMNSAERVLGGLRAKGYKSGDQAILQIEQSRNFLSAFWGIILGGIIPVPLPIPGSFPISEGMERITKVCEVLDRFCIITDQPAQNYRSLGNVDLLEVKELLEFAPDGNHHNPKPDDIAYLQFSSGSTGDPKGVMLSHFNLVYTIDASAKCVFDVRGNDIRPTLGYGIHILKHKLSMNDRLGSIAKFISWVSKGSLGKNIRSSKIGNDILDTLLIFSGNKISAYTDMRFNEIKIVNWMPYSHDMGLIGFHLAPTMGGMDQVKLEPKTFVHSPALFLKLIDKYRATHVPCPNFAVQWLTTQVNEDDIKGIDLSCIKCLGNGSEPISPSVSRNFIQKYEKFGFDERAMFMSYGMAEASLQVTAPPVFTKPVFHKVHKDVFIKDQIILPVSSDEDSIEITDLGAPVAGMKIRIVDDNDNLVHENTVGHIQLQGSNVVSGYYKNDAANKDLFCGPWLRTGDMGFMKNGRITLTGRRKDIIFVNGQNLYAHDIEEQVRRVPGMAFREFAITGLRHLDSDSEKVILFINTTESITSLSSLLSRLNENLVSSIGIKIDFIVPVHEIPRTPSAKVKRYSLRDKFEKGMYETVISLNDIVGHLSASKDEKGFELTGVEHRIIEIWRDVLGVDSISKIDNFFDLGGNSLRATKVTSRIREEFGIELGLKAVFESQTVEALAKVVESLTRKEPEDFSKIKPLEKAQNYELSHAQKRLWLLDKVVPDSPFYNIPGAVLIDGIELDLALLEKSLQAVTDRHETLRTVFRTINDEPVQVVNESYKIEMPIYDLTHEVDKHEKLQAIISEEKIRPFDLESGPLFRTMIIKLSATSNVFMTVMHHIISDGWSMALLVQEVIGNYLGFSSKNSSPYPELAIQYRDFAFWQNRLLEGDGIKEQEKYWLENLSGALPVLNLPTDRPRPTIQTQRAGTARIKIDQKTLKGIKELARKEDVTMFMMTLALFDVMLSKLSGQEDIIIGSPIAGRNNTQIEPLIGFFVNVLPMRINLSGNPNLSELLRRVKEMSIGAYANQEYPFDRLVEVINPVRDLSRTPIFDITFEYREASANPFAGISGISIKDVTGDDPNSRFDMSVTGYEEADGITMRFEYNADLYERSTIERFMDYYKNIINDVIKNPQKTISEIAILGEIEKKRVLLDFNNTSKEYPEAKCIHSIISERANEFKDKVALISRDREISYSEMERLSGNLAVYLMSHGIGKGDTVCILSERCPELIMAEIGIWKTGAMFVPVDPDYPTERIRYMIEDSGAKMFLTTSEMLQYAPKGEIELALINTDSKVWESDSIMDKYNQDPDSIAYVIYTSGSTGRPKGVKIRHRNLANFIHLNLDLYGINYQDRSSNLAGVAFDASAWEIWPYLCAGAIIVCLDKNLGKMMPEDLAEWFSKYNITRSFIPTKFAEIFVSEHFEGLTLKTLFTGGDRLSFVHSGGSYELINAYGPTETTVIASACDVTHWDNTRGVPPIGKPLPNIKIYILDKYLNPVPVGVTGQIYIGGAGVGAGYVNDPEKTKQVFIPDPFTEGAELIYATGDLARWLPDGNIDFIGRNDFQVEIRGYRVELGEIETVLSSYTGIKECVVIDKKDDEGQIRLVGFYVSDFVLNENEIKDYLREHLPPYLIPSRIIYLEAFPLTSNGKLDRTALSSMIDVTVDALREFIEPSTQTEKELEAFWRVSLGVEKISVNDNFFDIGGNSLRATRIVSWAREKYRIELPLKAIFENQTLGQLASEIDNIKSFGLKSVLPAIENIIPAEYYEVSHAQKRLWYIDKIVPNSPFYNIPGAVLIENTPIDLELLKEAFQAVVDRHESLRTTIVTINEKPFQKISDKMDLDIEIFDYRNSNEKDVKLRELIEKEKTKPFSIENGPLLRISVVRLTELSNALILNMHHIISDGWSMGILVREAFANYIALAQGKSSPFEELKIQYKDFADWQNKLLEGEEIKEQEKFWVDKLSGELPVLNMPTDRVRPAVQTQNGAVKRCNLSLDESVMLRNSAKDLNITPFMLTLSMFLVFLNRITAQEDIIVGTPVANRNNAQIEPLIGFFVNMLPIRVDISGNPSFSEFAKIVKQTCIMAYAHQDYPFDKLVEAINPARDLSRNPIFDVAFDFHEISANPIASVNLGGMKLKDITGDDTTSKFDFLVTGYESDEGVTFTFGYNTDLFNDNTVERLITYFKNLLEDVIVSPNKKLSEFSLIDDHETNRILYGFNDTVREYDKEKPVHVLFEEIAKRFPDKEALVFENKSMSYRDLNERSNRIAKYLRDNGVEKGTCVAVMVKRSFDMLVAVLGILKAGGAYVPIESEYPMERIQYMLTDIKTPVVVVNESLIGSLKGYEGHVLCLERFWDDFTSEGNSDLPNVNTCDDLAYIIYTSGSAGTPKGVMVPHVGITRLVKNTNYAEITDADRFLQVATIAFDAATMEFWGPLLNGGTLFLVSSEDSVNPDRIGELIIKHDISILFITTVMFNQLVDIRPDALANLKSLLTGGEMQSITHMRKAFSQVRPGVLTHVYGPTENTTYSTYYKVTAIPEDITGVPIGYPLANSTAYILDKYHNPVPIGIPGEIYVGGLGLAKGYLNDPEKTSGVFIPNPLAGVSENILYKTGDIGKWLPDGAIEIMGRIDQQVKIRGHRIELGEIETTIRKHELVRDTIVVVKDMGLNSKMLLAYYASDKEIPTDVFRTFLRESLPDYMVPNIFIRLDSLPLKKSGKVDKAALPEPKGLRPEMATEYVEPRNEIEEIIARAWQEVLGIDKIGIFDNFFDIGGDSIVSLQVVSRLNRKGFNLQPRDILQYQTIAELGSVIVFTKGIEAEQGAVTGSSTLTPIQRWFFSQKLHNENHFNQALLFSSQSRLDEDALKKAFQALIDHHDVLRSRFVDSSIQEFIALGEEVAFRVVTLENDALMGEEILKLQASLNINEGPIFAAGLLHASAEDYLVVACHHLVVDGVSWRILMEDLMTGYFQVIGGGNVELPEKSTSFKEWANKLSEYALESQVAAEEIWWKGILSDELPQISIEQDLGPNNIASVSAATVELNEKETSQLLKEAHHAYNTDVIDLLIVALSESISLWTGSDKVAFVLEGHGRENVIEDIDVSRTVGWFTTMYPVVLNVFPDMKDKIKNIKETLHRIPHKGFNYGILRYLNSIELPFTSDISFNYLGQLSNPTFDGFKLATTDVSGIMDVSNLRANLIDIVAMVVNGKLRVNFIYSQNKFTMFTINSLAISFKKRLSEIIAHCMDPSNFDVTPSDFELIDLGQEQLDKLINFE